VVMQAVLINLEIFVNKIMFSGDRESMKIYG
jgi:hypothetical protein